MAPARPCQIAIVLYPGFAALDAIGPYDVLKLMPGSQIRLVTREPGPVPAERGVLHVGATHSFDETQRPDVVLVPGSEADTTTAMADGALIGWLQRVHETTAITASVCSGALVLAAAGLLEGLPATTHWWAQGSLPRFGAEPRPEERIVRAGKVWTAAGVSAGLDLALAIVAELAGPAEAEIAQLLIEYDPQPPFDAGHPRKAPPAVKAAAANRLAASAKNPRNAISIPKILWRRALSRARSRLS